MKRYDVPMLQGLVLDYHRRIIPENKVALAKNVYFEEAKVKTRWGYGLLGSNTPFTNGPSTARVGTPITGFAYYKKLRTVDEWVLAFTTRDVFYYDSANNLWKFLTKCYSTGGCQCDGAGNVTSTGATPPVFDDVNWTKAGIYEIGFGSTDPDAITTWYQVNQVTGETTLTLTENGPTHAVDQVYVLRLCWNGGENDYFSSAYPIEQGTFERIIVSCNGVDRPQYWDGTGYFSDLLDTSTSEGIERDGNLAISATPEQFQIIRSLYYRIAGEDYRKGTTDGLTFSLAHQITADLWGIVLIQINAAGTISTKVLASPQSYANEAAALATYGVTLLPDTSNIALGYITVHAPAGSTWDANTDDMTPASDCQNANFYDATTVTMPVVNIAKYLEYYYDKLIMGWVIDTGANYPQTIECAVRANPRDFTNVGHEMYDLVDGTDEIVGFKLLSSRVVVYKENSITVLWWTGNELSPLDYKENAVSEKGTPSISTVADFVFYHIFMGWDDIYLFDGNRVVPIGSEIKNTLFGGLNSEKIKYSFAVPIKEKNLYCLFVPSQYDYCDQVWVYNTQEKTWAYWELANLMTAHGFYKTEQSITWNDLHVLQVDGTRRLYNTGTVTTSGAGNRTVTLAAGTWDTSWTLCSIKFNTASYIAAEEWYEVLTVDSPTQITLAEDGPVAAGVAFVLGSGFAMADWIGRIMDQWSIAESKTYILGDKDGYVYEMSTTAEADNGAPIYAYFETRDYPLNDIEHVFTLLKIALGMREGAADGYIRIYTSVDFGETWSTVREINLFSPTFFREHFINYKMRGKQVRIRIENVAGSSFELESLQIMFEDAGIALRR